MSLTRFILQKFSASVAGLVPASGGGTTNFLRADGTWAAPVPQGLGTAAFVDVPATGDAATDEAVLGSDSRLTDARTPTAHAASHAANGSDPLTLSSDQITGLAAVATSGAYSDLTGAPALAAVATSGAYFDLTGKPTLGTAAAKDIPATGDASTSQVVYGTDSRLADSRTPTAHASSHAAAGSDPIAISASQVSGLAAVATSGSAADLSTGTLPAARMPNPGATTLGGVKSLAAVSHKFLTSIGTDGTPTQAQPAAGDISGLAASATTDTTNASNIGSGTLAAARMAVMVGDSGSGGTQGAVPAPAAGDAAAAKFLKADGTWANPGSGASDFTGDSGSGGIHGLVPAPAAGDAAAKKFLSASGGWAQPGFVLLTSGVISSAQATLDIVLTAYTGFRTLKIILDEFIPATDGVDLWMRFSTNGGTSYDTTGYEIASTRAYSGNTTLAGTGANGQGQIAFLNQSAIGNGAAEGCRAEITIYGRTNTALWTQCTFEFSAISNDATPRFFTVHGGGMRATAQDTDAIRWLFSSGNIASAKYQVYGLAA